MMKAVIFILFVVIIKIISWGSFAMQNPNTPPEPLVKPKGCQCDETFDTYRQEQGVSGFKQLVSEEDIDAIILHSSKDLPLHRAVMFDCVPHTIANLGEIKTEDSLGHLPLEIALAFGNWECAEILWREGGFVKDHLNKKGENILYCLSHSSDAGIPALRWVDRLIKVGVNPCFRRGFFDRKLQSHPTIREKIDSKESFTDKAAMINLLLKAEKAWEKKEAAQKTADKRTDKEDEDDGPEITIGTFEDKSPEGDLSETK